jgi:hypothetical protein
MNVLGDPSLRIGGPRTLEVSPAGGPYDVVRGDLRTLRESAGDFATSASGCVADQGTTTSVAEPSVPPLGEGTWYLVRGVGISGPMTWQTLAGPQVGVRDEGIAASPTSCP